MKQRYKLRFIPNIHTGDGDNPGRLDEPVVDFLREIQASGSLRKAAWRERMSSRRAWEMIYEVEDAFGFKLAERKGRRRSRLTPEGEILSEIYAQMDLELNAYAKTFFMKRGEELGLDPERIAELF
jgi:molybdate transport repressor ModE-like protein